RLDAQLHRHARYGARMGYGRRGQIEGKFVTAESCSPPNRDTASAIPTHFRKDIRQGLDTTVRKSKPDSAPANEEGVEVQCAYSFDERCRGSSMARLSFISRTGDLKLAAVDDQLCGPVRGNDMRLVARRLAGGVECDRPTLEPDPQCRRDIDR